MPVKDGFDAASEIRSIEKQHPRSLAQPLLSIPIVALTATTYPTELQRAINCGANETLSKPVSQLQLEECVYRILKSAARLTPTQI